MVTFCNVSFNVSETIIFYSKNIIKEKSRGMKKYDLPRETLEIAEFLLVVLFINAIT